MSANYYDSFYVCVTPGRLPQCIQCSHLVLDQHRNGHPQPCGVLRWEGSKWRRPKITVVDGKALCENLEVLCG